MIIQDKIILDLNKSRRVKDAANGYLTIFGNPVAVAGVYPYRRYEVDDNTTESNSLDIVNVYRPLDNLIKIKDDFARKPIIRDHEWVGINGTKTNVDGAIGNDVWNNENALYSDIIVYNPDVIRDIEDGVCRELSPGYKAEIQQQTGEYKGVSYEYVMNIKSVNHLAIVDKGRAGSDLRLLDKGDNIMNNEVINESISDDKKSDIVSNTILTNSNINDKQVIQEAKKQEETKEGIQTKESEVMDTSNFLTKAALQDMFLEFKKEFTNFKDNFKSEIKELSTIKNQIQSDTGIRLQDGIDNKNDLYTIAYEELTGNKLAKGHDAKTAYEIALSNYNQMQFYVEDSNENEVKLDNDVINRIKEIQVSPNYQFSN